MEMAASTSDGEQQSPQPEVSVMNDQGYTKELASHLNQLRHENTLCDVTIIIGQRRFQAHKVVLCATSSYFSAMFTGSFHESSQSEVTIPEGSRVAFEKLLDFAYTGGLLLSTTTITDIISMACYMQFNRAIPLCALFLRQSYVRKSIQPQDAFTILNMANSHQLFLIEESARDYLASRFVEFCEMSCFLEEVSAEYVESVLGRKDLGLWATEEQILKAVVAWLKNDWENRQSHAASLLKHIKLGLVPLTILKGIMDEDVVAELPECREMIADVEKCLALKDASKVPMSVRYPEQFATRGTITTVLAVDNGCIDFRETKCFENERWIPLRKFPKRPVASQFRDVRDQQVIVANNELYHAGGEYLQEKSCSDLFYRYNRLTNKWKALRPMITRRSGFPMVHLNDHIYAIGGNGPGPCRGPIGGNGPGPWPLDEVERYSLLTGEWETVAELPEALTSPSAVVYKDKILVYGMLQLSNNGPGLLLAYDPDTDTWTELLSEITSVMSLNDFSPVLVVEDNHCYRVMYVNDVARVNRLTLQLDNTTPLTGQLGSSHNPSDQAEMSIEPDAGPFCINKRVFVNLRGYVHRLDITVENMHSGDCDDTRGWEQINGVMGITAACVNFTFDKYRVV